ncbi:MAG: hypothetical protein ACLFPV_05525 [Spirochaetaceae bacterium]
MSEFFHSGWTTLGITAVVLVGKTVFGLVLNRPVPVGCPLRRYSRSIRAGLIVYLLCKLSAVETAIVSWIFGFVMMWLVIGNLNVLPFGLLLFAVPLRILEVIVAVFLGRRIAARAT